MAEPLPSKSEVKRGSEVEKRADFAPDCAYAIVMGTQVEAHSALDACYQVLNFTQGSILNNGPDAGVVRSSMVSISQAANPIANSIGSMILEIFRRIMLLFFENE